MSEKGFTEDGFFPRTPSQIEQDYQETASDVYEEINYGPGSPLYQLYKIVRLREYEMELNLQAMTSGLSIDTAEDLWLDKWCENFGIFRKTDIRAGGYVELTINDLPSFNDSPNYYNTAGVEYYSNKGLKYVRSDQGYVFDRVISLTRGKTNTDGLPDPYTEIGGTGFVNSQSDGSGADYNNVVFNSSDQVFDWSSSEEITTGSKYYVELSGYATIRENIVATSFGSGYNIGANTIREFRDTEDPVVPTSSNVNNPSAISGGADEEADKDLRTRAQNILSSSFTYDRIKILAENIEGVRSARAYQALGTDQATITEDWDVNKTTYDDDGIYVSGEYADISGEMYSQKFNPTHGIPKLNKLVLYGKRIGHPPPLIVGLRELNANTYKTTGSLDTYEVDPPADEEQDMIIDLDFFDLDHTETYQLDFWGAPRSGMDWNNNKWFVATGAISGNLVNTGYLIEQDGTSGDANMIFKTKWGNAGVNVDLALEEGSRGFTQIQSDLDNQLSWEDGQGYAVAGVDYTINETDTVDIYVQGTLYILQDANATFDTISGRIEANIRDYINDLQPGRNVIYSKIYYNIMRDSDVWRVSDLKIYEKSGDLLEDEDIFIDNTEVAYFQSTDFDKG